MGVRQRAPKALRSHWEHLDTSHALRLSPEMFEDKQKINTIALRLQS